MNLIIPWYIFGYICSISIAYCCLFLCPEINFMLLQMLACATWQVKFDSYGSKLLQELEKEICIIRHINDFIALSS